ncbi:MAG: hypothetical protein ACO36I_22065, partial [Candidatus Latescibacterota bacterium]
VASHPAMPSSGLLRLSEDTDLDVRKAVVQNPNTTIGALEKLAFDADGNIRRTARNRLGKLLKKQIATDRER